MKIDKEILDDFVAEIKIIEKELKVIIDQIIQTKMEDATLFQKFGQVIDRIYGTAATLGFKEITDYTRCLKSICYMSGQSPNMKGREKVVRMMVNSLKYLNDLTLVIEKPEEIDKIKILLNQEIGRASLLEKKEFFGITKKSCD